MGIDAQIAYITNGYGKVQHLEEIDVDMGRQKMSNGEYKIVLDDEVIAQGSVNDIIDAVKRYEAQIKQFDYVEKTIYSLLNEHNFNSYREYIDFAIKIRNLPTPERIKLVKKEVAINKY